MLRYLYLPDRLLRPVLVAGALATLPTGLAGQEASGVRWFPAEPLFAAPIAAPLEPRFAAGLLVTSLFASDAEPRERPPFLPVDPEDDARQDLQAAVSVGTTIPIAQWGDAGGTRFGVGFQVLATERFRMEEPSRDALGGDWIAAVPFEIAGAGGTTWRVRALHRSAHLGDEFMEEAQARRIEVSHEAVDVLASHMRGPLRVYGGGAVVVRSQTYVYAAAPATVLETPSFLRAEADDRYALQLGLELAPPGSDPIRPVLAVEWQRSNHEESDQVNAMLGMQGTHGGRTARLLFQCHAGASPMGEFFLTSERYCGLTFTLEI